MDAQEALNILRSGAMKATMIFLPEGGKRVVADADRSLYMEAEKVLQDVIDLERTYDLAGLYKGRDRQAAIDAARTNQGRTADGPTASVGHDHGSAEIGHDVCEGEGQGVGPDFRGLGESGTGSAIDTDGFDAHAD